MHPGEYFLKDEAVIANPDRKTVKLTVRNSGDRPVQVGSHYHFFETNRALIFDREKALGMCLNLPAATAVRFEPGQTHEIELVEFAGSGTIYGFNRLVEGDINDPDVVARALENVKKFISND